MKRLSPCRTALMALLLLTGAAPAARAGDAAELNILGFSADMRHFAFEQFGMQDGSGFAYDEIFVIDLARDAWVKGTPIRVQARDEDQSLPSVMKDVHAKYAAFEKSLALTSPARILARTPVTEVTADRKTLAFDTWYLSSEFGSTTTVPETLKEVRYQLSLTEKPLPRPGTCPADMGDDYRGFSLKLKAQKDGTEREVFADASLPATRGCPFGYDIAAVVDGFDDSKTQLVVAIIGVYSLGFEGKDLRYMAVPFKLVP